MKSPGKTMMMTTEIIQKVHHLLRWKRKRSSFHISCISKTRTLYLPWSLQSSMLGTIVIFKIRHHGGSKASQFESIPSNICADTCFRTLQVIEFTDWTHQSGSTEFSPVLLSFFLHFPSPICESLSFQRLSGKTVNHICRVFVALRGIRLHLCV